MPLLPKDVRVIGVDLLGFGESPKPAWLRYDATAQARSVGLTLLKLGLNQKVTLVGHSLGALVAVAIAKRYPLLVSRMVLCSPPFYRPTKQGSIPTRDDILKQIYEVARRRPERLISLSPLAVKLGLANRVLNIDEQNVGAYVQALGSSVINQTSLNDLRRLRVPTRILYGSLDPVVVGGNIARATKDNPHITARRLLAGHEIVGKYVKVVAQEIIVGSNPRT